MSLCVGEGEVGLRQASIVCLTVEHGSFQGRGGVDLFPSHLTHDLKNDPSDDGEWIKAMVFKAGVDRSR